MLDIQSVDKIRLNGYGMGQITPAWVREFKLNADAESLTFSYANPHDLTCPASENPISYQRSTQPVVQPPNPTVKQPVKQPVKQLVHPRLNRKQAHLYPTAKLLWAGVILLFIAPLALFVDRFIFSATTQHRPTEFVLGKSANAIGTTSTQAIVSQNTASSVPGIPSATSTSTTREPSDLTSAVNSASTINSDAPDAFREAVSQATLAAELTQTARTQEEWQKIVQLWHEAAFLMSQVSWEHPQYDTAQQRVQQYQNNRVYAEQQLY
jgi:hypothetical protein